MVDVVREVIIWLVISVKLHEVRDCSDDVGLGESELCLAALWVRRRNRKPKAIHNSLDLRVLVAKLLRDFVAANLRKVVALRVEEESVDEFRCCINCWRLTWSQLLVELYKSLLYSLSCVLLERVAHRVVRVALWVKDEV